LQPKLHGLRIV